MARGRAQRRGLADRKDADPARIVETFLDHAVEFIVIGGVAALAHGVQRITRDIDFLVEPTKVNCRRTLHALASLGAEEYRPLAKKWIPVSASADPDWLLKEPRLCDSDAGGVDICNAIEGTPGWQTAVKDAVAIQAFDREFRVLSKDNLIASKIVAGREKDRADIAELNEF